MPRVNITVDFLDSEVDEDLLVTGEKKRGPAIRKPALDVLRLKRTGRPAEKFNSGERGVKRAGFEKGRAHDRIADGNKTRTWRS